MSICGKSWTIAAGEHEVTVAEVGAGLRRYTHDGVDVTCPYGEGELPPKGCGTTLVPWPNRIRDGRYVFEGVTQQLALTEPDPGNAIHGLGRWERWTKVRQAPDRITLRLDVVPQKGYPFEVRAEVTYALHPSDGLTVTTSARNTGRDAAPFGAGAHPYLCTRGHRIDDTTLTLPAREILVVDEQKVPVGTRTLTGTGDFRRGRRLRDQRFDDGFTGLTVRDGRGAASIRTRAGGAELWFDADYRFLQVYTVDDLTPGCSGVAIEPMTCAPDAFNTGDGLIVLAPGDRWSASWGVTPR